MKLRSFEENFSKYFSDPDFTREYLESAFDEDGVQGFLVALQNVIKATEGMTKVADDIDVGRESLYKSLSEAGNPQIKTIDGILKLYGLRLSISSLKVADE